MKRSLLALAVSTALIGSGAQAGVIIFDNFNQDPLQLNWAGDLVFKSVPSTGLQGQPATDLIGGNFHLCSPDVSSNHCVDLDGTTGIGHSPAGELQSLLSVAAGPVVLDFDLGGNRRFLDVAKTIPAPGQTTKVSVGNWSTTISLSQAAPLTHYHFAFTTTGGPLDFLELGPSDLRGNVLDNVVLSVPEPATWAMMLMGFGLTGFAIRRRAKGVSA